ncbi:piggyBac transposable element-derived protein 4-like [Spodoptera litura]|uniref:PiggyBac transposable element-derived protein 4-like n=1 Tax=Spodoptera litura TaxID=69820 RepID=A0A9J7EPG8_SPOLT|nr:piggyBac transposable element-derived protein 4-like [Spodoptera litura]
MMLYNDEELLTILQPSNNDISSGSSLTDSDNESEHEESSTTWSETAFTPELCEFNDYIAGINSNGVDFQSKELECFLHFLGDDIILKIIEFTNAQHQKFIRRCDIRVFSRLQNWREISVAEMYVFLAVTFLFTRNKHLTIEEHWATDHLLQSPIFSKTMSRNRYTTILGLLSFALPGTDSGHVLKDILPLLQHIKNSFRSSLTPYRDLCIDESIMPYKGYISIKQYIPNKRNRFGIKLFIMCDVKTKFIIEFIIYCGSRTEIDDPNNLGITGAVVTNLLEGLTDENRRIYADNWYSSPKLYQYLHNRKTYACGTVRLNRLKKAGAGNFKPLKKGEIHALYNKPLMALKYKDKRDIYMLSTCHTAEFGPTNKYNRQTGLPVMKPEIIIDYNKKKGIVDNTDMLLHSVQCIRKSKIWHKKLGLHLIDLCMLNAHAFFKIFHTNTSLADFQLGVIRQLIEKYKAPELEYSIPTTSRSTSALRLAAQNLADHMPEYTKGKKSRPCFVCQHTKLHERRRRESRFMCEICQVTLCIVPCFKIYHKQNEF